MTLSEIQELEHLAAPIASGTLAGREAAAELATHSGATGTSADVVHLLYHIDADADLHAKDPEYGYQQRRRLAMLLNALRNGAVAADLRGAKP